MLYCKRENAAIYLQRGQERVEIEVSDWFLPNLYQADEDTQLVSRMTQELPKPHKHNLSALPDAGFWGRRRELWQIENWFVDGIRRVVVSGFSGQGKTFLAQELGRWLLQKANFDAVVFVDYSGYQGQDAVQWAVTTLGSVLEQTLVDVAAANAVLQTNRILLILANLEARLNQLIVEMPDNTVEATLQLVIEQLDEELQECLSLLGIFKGGVFEDDLLEITGITELQWKILNKVLKKTALIKSEYLWDDESITYLKFHPFFTNFLWERLSAQKVQKLTVQYCQEYYQLSIHLQEEDLTDPHYARIVIQRELPNLLYAVYWALDQLEEWALVCGTNLSR